MVVRQYVGKCNVECTERRMKSNGRYNGSMCTMCTCTAPNGWLVGDEFKPFDIVKKFEVWSIQHDQFLRIITPLLMGLPMGLCKLSSKCLIPAFFILNFFLTWYPGPCSLTGAALRDF